MAALVLGAVLFGSVATQDADPPKHLDVFGQLQASAVRIFTRDDVERALSSASPRAACIARREVPSLNPYAIGAQGEQGMAQLHPHGLLTDFYRRGSTNPFDPDQALAYIDDALRRGLARHWSVVTLGLCP